MGREEQNVSGTNEFNHNYEHNALLQKRFNAQIIQDMVAYIIRRLGKNNKSIKILDLCCGDGGITNALLHELELAGIEVETIVGYDISTAQIEIATTKYASKSDKLKFQVQDVAMMSDQNEFDVVISLFGLHWISDIYKMAENIFNALKSNGIAVYFVPLEKDKLFQLRQAIIDSSEWAASFRGFKLNPFFSEPENYIQAFRPFFDSEDAENISGTETVEFTEENFKKFMSSWMQEIRYLQMAENQQNYLNSLVSQIPEKNANTCRDVEKVISPNAGPTKIFFHERFFWFHGQKKFESKKDMIVNAEAGVSEQNISKLSTKKMN